MLDITKLMAAQDGNRRYDQRVTWSSGVRFRLGNGTFQKARVEDVSLGGLRLVLPKALPEGSRIQVLYTPPGSTRQHWVEGVVRWARERSAAYLTGVELEYCSASDQVPFEKMVAALQGSLAA